MSYNWNNNCQGVGGENGVIDRLDLVGPGVGSRL